MQTTIITYLVLTYSYIIYKWVKPSEVNKQVNKQFGKHPLAIRIIGSILAPITFPSALWMGIIALSNIDKFEYVNNQIAISCRELINKWKEIKN